MAVPDPCPTVTDVNTPNATVDPQTEDEVLAALLVAPFEERLDLMGNLGADPGWTNPIRSALHAAIGRLNTKTIDVRSLRGTLVDAGYPSSPEGGDLGGWLVSLERNAPLLPVSRRDAAERLVTLSRRRQMVEDLNSASMRLSAGADPAEAAASIAEAVDRVLSTTHRSATYNLSDLFTDWADKQEAAFTRGAAPEWSTGSRSLDSIIDGFHPGDTLICGGRPGQGKTVFALDLTRALTRQGGGVLFISLEMPAVQLLGRLVAAEYSYDATEARRTHDETALEGAMVGANAFTTERSNTLSIVDTASGGALTWRRIAALVRREQQLMALRGVKMVAFVVDYLQNVPQEARGRELSPREHYGAVVQGLSALGKELEVGFVGLSQLARPSSNSEIRPPSMFELKETSDLEQAADQIILLHRPDQYDEEARPKEVDLIVAKSRHGEPGTVTLVHQLQFYRFQDMAPAWVSEPPNNDTF